MKVLIVDDEPDILDIVEFSIESLEHDQIEIFKAEDVPSAINILKERPNIEVVVSDYRMPGQSGGDLLKFMQDSFPRVEFVLCSAHIPDELSDINRDDIFDFIRKPNISEGIERIFGRYFEAVAKGDGFESKDSQSYLPISTKLLFKIGVAPDDVFVKLSDTKFVRYLKKGDLFDQSDLSKYESKNVFYLFVPSVNKSIISSTIEKSVLALLINKEIDPVVKEQSCHQYVTAAIREYGVTVEFSELTKKTVELALDNLSTQGELNDLLMKVLSSGSYPSQLYLLTSHFSHLILEAAGWNSESNIYKLVLGSFLQDICLDKTEWVSYFFKEDFRHLEKEEQDRILVHPVEAAKLVEKFPEVPSDVDKLILQHHEVGQGIGFPDGLSLMRIFPLSAVLIVANLIARSALENGESFKLEDEYERIKNSLGLDSGPFKKVMTALQTLI